jgi:ankyrin repeat protein
LLAAGCWEGFAMASKQQYRALRDFEPSGEDELGMAAGDIISLLDSQPGEDNSWKNGRNTTSGKEGLFPLNFCELYESEVAKSVTSDEPKDALSTFVDNEITYYEAQDTEESQTPAQDAEASRPSSQEPFGSNDPQKDASATSADITPQYRAVYDFSPDGEDELGFKKGDLIVMTKPKDTADEWRHGYNTATYKHGLFPLTFCVTSDTRESINNTDASEMQDELYSLVETQSAPTRPPKLSRTEPSSPKGGTGSVVSRQSVRSPTLLASSSNILNSTVTRPAAQRVVPEDQDIITRINDQNKDRNLWLACTTSHCVRCAQHKLRKETGKLKKRVSSTCEHILQRIVHLVTVDGADINYQNEDALGTTPLMAAAEKGFANVTKFLVQDCRADPNKTSKQGKTALHIASRIGSKSVVSLLLAAKAQPLLRTVTHENTPPHFAAMHGKIEILKLFLTTGLVYINTQNAAGDTFLHCASAHGHTATVQYLLDKGAMPNVRNQTKSTPLQLAAQNGHIGSIKLLIKFGDEESVNNQNHHGKTALHFVAEHNNIEMLHLILENKGRKSTNLPDFAGEVPLHGAVRNKCSEACKVLFKEYNANPTYRNLSGESPLSLALAQKNSNYQRCYDQLRTSLKRRKQLEKEANSIKINSRDNFVLEYEDRKRAKEQLSPEQLLKKSETRRGNFVMQMKKKEDAALRRNLFVTSASKGLEGKYYVVG